MVCYPAIKSYRLLAMAHANLMSNPHTSHAGHFNSFPTQSSSSSSSSNENAFSFPFILINDSCNIIPNIWWIYVNWKSKTSPMSQMDCCLMLSSPFPPPALQHVGGGLWKAAVGGAPWQRGYKLRRQRGKEQTLPFVISDLEKKQQKKLCAKILAMFKLEENL